MTDQKPIRVILTDDHQVVRHGIRQILEVSGIDVIAEADNGQEALDMIEKYETDVIVLDIQMPDISGIQVAKKIRSTESSVGILILTAFDDKPFLDAALQAGVDGFILKTADMEDIVQAVQDVFDGTAHIDANQMHGKEDSSLTNRELEVLKQASYGYTNKEIGNILHISSRTVQGHLRKIYDKLSVSSRTEAVVKATQIGILELPTINEKTSD